MSMRVLALVIVYGTAPLQTTSLQTLLASKFDHSRLRILVWDNSKAPAPHAEELDALGVGYVSTPDNLALSMIYNRVIANHLQQGEHLLHLAPNSLETL
jgi:hypothetical protein